MDADSLIGRIVVERTAAAGVYEVRKILERLRDDWLEGYLYF